MTERHKMVEAVCSHGSWMLLHSAEYKLDATDSDAAMALALQQEFRREEASSHHDSLEEKGLFFCQMCQKNLSAMNVTRREQHVNR
jgi:structure-specific endonuclease subunit SLX4 (BTB/POZ domain-containing protein 12)